MVGVVWCGVVSGFCQTNQGGKESNSIPSGVNSTNQSGPPTRKRPKAMRAEHYVGTLTKVDGTNLVINARISRNEIKEISIPTDSQTEFRKDGAVGHLQDLQPGMVVAISRNASYRSVPGKLRVLAHDPELIGVVIKADTTNVVIHVSQPGVAPHDVNVLVNAATRILVGTEGEGMPTKPGKLGDLKPGTDVNVVPATGGTATRIIITAVPEIPPKE